MAAIKVEIRSGVYYDSAVLMQLQRSLASLPGIEDAGVVMGTESNKELLAHIDLTTPEVDKAQPNDLVIVVRGVDEQAAAEALGKVDELLTRKKGGAEQAYRPRSIEGANDMLPEASWVLVSVAGRYAAGVAREAMRLGKHVFLFSDNVSVEEEIALKQEAAEKGLLVMGPDCGTALIGGFGLGFANKVRRGNIGVVAAAGTGLQHVTSRIHQLGGGITHGIGTGGRDLSEKVGAVTFRQGIELLSRDPETKVIVLVSKPPSPKVAEEVLKLARRAGKPVVVNFIARPLSLPQMDNLYFARGLDHAAELAVELSRNLPTLETDADLGLERFAAGQKYLRGLFSGGTLAYEAQHILASYLPKVYANAPINKELKLPNSYVSQEHCIVDLGEDEFTQGRLHPMMDNELRIRRLMEEAADPSVAVILLDVVIGYGSHPDPASELGPAVAKAKALAKEAGRYLEVIAVVCGTDEDPQKLEAQVQQMKEGGAWVSTSNEEAMRYAGRLVRALSQEAGGEFTMKPVDLTTLQRPLAAINVGLESFAENLAAQGAPVIHVDWRPPAGGNERLMSILERMKQRQ
ncbi:acyl-CoA synthetase FdrA [Anaerolinea sp.]|uniref:acyl-CoA synthetase FdrA n=1 Tax=Anaerolinea sp. TaxID=1872519 RepID=UPI0026093C60|nr:acyl-CoA synthetase FdrA [uncultured Anaerolinea sp.]